MTPTNSGGFRRPLVDPHTGNLVELVVNIRVECAHCGSFEWLEYWSDEGRLVRRLAPKQPCWHYRANQLSSLAPTGDLTTSSHEGILKRERR